MAREWEQAPTEVFDTRVDGILYRRYNRKKEALNERKFRREDLTEQDLRHGNTRLFMSDDPHSQRDLLEVFRTKNTFEGLID
jgi:hypothetical protein